MRNALSLAAVCFLVLVVAGCDSFSSSAASRSGGVAVVDLDEVARQLGVDQVLVERINQQEASLNGQLHSLQSTLRDQFQQKSQELKVQPAASSQASSATTTKQQLSGLEGQLNRQLAQAQQKARQQLGAYRQQLVRQFRAEVVPVAQQVAKTRGLGVVLVKNDSVLLAFDQTHDITASVIARLRELHAVAPSPSPATATAAAPPVTQRR